MAALVLEIARDRRRLVVSEMLLGTALPCITSNQRRKMFLSPNFDPFVRCLEE